MGLIFAMSAQPDLPHPESGWLDLLMSSGAHIFLFAVLSFLLARALSRRPKAWLIALVATTLYAVSDELHQAFVPGRHPDPLDLVCDVAGAALGLLCWRLLVRRRAGQARSPAGDGARRSL
jgi:VanZ family protein